MEIQQDEEESWSSAGTVGFLCWVPGSFPRSLSFFPALKNYLGSALSQILLKVGLFHPCRCCCCLKTS